MKEKENEQEAFNWLDKNKLSYDIWDKKYRFNGESFQEWLDRVSNNDEEVKQLIKEKKFLFGGRILANRNIDLKGKTYSNCYVLPKIEDSIESIYDTCAKLARTYSYGGGCGIDISNLRPKGAFVNNAAKTTTGAISFMDTFSQVTETIGQCIAGNQHILTDNGIKTMSELTIGERVFTRKGFVKVINKIDKGIQLTKKVTTTHGNSIITTSDHPFVTCSEKEGIFSKELNDLLIGDNLVLLAGKNSLSEYLTLNDEIIRPKREISNQTGKVGEMEHNRYKECTIPTILEEKLAYLLGYMSGDGYTSKKNVSVSCNSNDVEIIAKIIKYTEDVFGITPWIKDYKTYKVLIIGGFDVKEFLKNNNIGKPKTDLLSVHEAIFKSPVSVQNAYLSGLFDADGYASEGRNLYRITTVNEKFAKDIQLLFNICGIISKIEEEQPKNINWKKKYNVTIVGSVNKIALKHSLTESCKVSSKEISCLRDNLLTPFTSHTIGQKHTKEFNYVPANGFVSVNCLQKLKNCGKYNDELLYLDTIKSIDNFGETNVYDITLEDENMFWCNGIYVHNCGRRGALMISISCMHPDIQEFINIKNDLNKVTSANISVRVTDDFMMAVEQDKDFILKYPVDKTYKNIDLSNINYNELINAEMTDGSKGYIKRVKAKEVFKLLCKNNWDYAEPGILYWDAIENWNLLNEDENFEYEGVNPCAEEPLPGGGSCLLGSINLSEFVENETFKYDDFIKTVKQSVNALNTILNEGLTLHPLDIQQESVSNWRQIGLGIMGLADMLIKLKMKYDSDEAIEFCKDLSHIMAKSAIEQSLKLAIDYGCYKKCDKDKLVISSFIKEHIKDEETLSLIRQYGLYNSQLLTCAPTGTISTKLQISGGIEPIFAMKYKRTTKSLHGHDETYDVFTKIAEEWMTEHNSTELPEYFVDSTTINPEQRIKMQAAWQNGIDASISSTINLPERSTVEQVEDIYINAWKHKLKGVTIFRENCKRIAILSTSDKPTVTAEETHAQKRPKEIPCEIIRFRNGSEKWVALLGILNDHPYEIFTGIEYKLNIPSNVNKGLIRKEKQNGLSKYSLIFVDEFNNKHVVESINQVFNPEFYNLGKMLSMSFRHRVPIQYVVEQLNSMKFDNDTINSWRNGVIRTLKKYIKDGEKSSQQCPECGAQLVYEGGCSLCKECGFSKCG